ncbi:PREDICTED: 28S ribosomal protein S9, mitochondrial [Trachymyrmex cornetzi]|uniref:28S ribosomal protein S9, mitochondrial n=1 Tax=Trachymyrmex cornetzi TaxID=471704 RepID=UPI00084F705B|nr:PREDICTED: 28S ribosomal protein S9, mitochondrial [Trachymyrmex cornetzi]
MAVSAFIRCSHFRRLVGVSNNVVALFPDSVWYLNRIKSQSYATSISEIEDTTKTNIKKSEKKISKAMMMYLQRAKEHDAFMKEEILEYEIGKRHLANMMGEDPESFTQADINRSIEYLFPSGLFDPKARPIMEHPDKIFPSKKVAEFDETGKPFHSMFYTSKPNYYETLYNIVDNIEILNDIEDSLIKQGILPMDRIDLVGSSWLTQNDIEKLFLERLNNFEYNYLITSLERLCDHPLSRRATDFILKYCRTRNTHFKEIVLPLEHDSTGRPYVTVKNCMRKSARGEVTIWGNGSGKIVINGRDIGYFEDFQHRQQA